jgi:tetratricopeptide (TPR) repeat protein
MNNSLEKIEAAIALRDGDRVSQLLEELQQQDPDNLWIIFYLARLDELSNNLERAEKNYREVLQNATHSKIISQARQGIERLQAIERERQQKARDRAMNEPGSDDPGVLILKPMTLELKEKVVKKFAKIFNIDPYNARLQLPTRCWRLYRAGTLGELKFYEEAIAEVGIPGFCFPLRQIDEIQVYQVQYFQSIFPAIAICLDRNAQTVTIEFDWSQVAQQVEALLPIFEQCVDRDVRGKLIRKTQIQDYIKVCDLHLPAKNAIVRLWDRNYQFERGVSFFEQQQVSRAQTTLSDKWNHLTKFIKQQLKETPIWSDFNTFVGMTLDFPETLKSIEPQIDLLRAEACLWDNSFQLYSFLVSLDGDRSLGLLGKARLH